MPYFRIVIALVLAMLMHSPATAATKLSPFDYNVVQQTNTPILLVSVKSIAPGQWTNGNPPKTTLKIQDTLRGDKTPITIEAIWQPMPPDFTWAGKDETSRLKEWQDKPLSAPPVRSKWYVAGEIFKGVLYISPLMRRPVSNDLYKEIAPLAFKTEKDKEAQRGNLQAIEEDAARAQRLEQWDKSLQAGKVKDLLTSADLVAVVTVAEMDSDERMVRFAISQLIKPAESKTTPETLKLAGFPDLLYSQLYDFKQSSTTVPNTLLIFMKKKLVTNEDGTQQELYVPINSTQVAMPATKERLKDLRVKEK